MIRFRKWSRILEQRLSAFDRRRCSPHAGLSVAGVFTPVPGGRFALQALKYSERGAEMTYTAVRGAEAASSVAKAAETAAKGAGIVAKDGTAITGRTKHGVD